jgi:hypothetical protein
MIAIDLSWIIKTIYHSSNSQELEIKDILNVFNEVHEKSGVMSIDIANPSSVGPQRLQIRTEAGNSIIMLTEFDDDDEDHIRVYINVLPIVEKVTILGDIWDSRIICTNYDIAKRIVQEFVETGNVSMDLLN